MFPLEFCEIQVRSLTAFPACQKKLVRNHFICDLEVALLSRAGLTNSTETTRLCYPGDRCITCQWS